MGKQQVNMTPSGHYPATEQLVPRAITTVKPNKGQTKVSINLKLGQIKFELNVIF